MVKNINSGGIPIIKVWEGWGDGEMGRWGDGEMGRWGDFYKATASRQGNYPEII
ncbi:hypothetical protein [Moorena sp. SIOASIH]|uniref:hypothetical protein n=1 Tax=Moorena sp. SIOASIH TaxID=2607817 RepID=UPI0026010C7C|nr:hypothetical protein [Moorena sp. SIOASIH]